MGNLRACSAIALLALAACGSDHAKDVDAAVIKIPDAAIDAKVFMDAPPPTVDLSCLNNAGPTTAPATIAISGTTQSLGQGGATPVPMVPVAVYKNTSTTPLGMTVSDTAGAFMITAIATGGMPIDGYLKVDNPVNSTTYRTSYVYPPEKVAMDLTGVPGTMISEQTFTTLTGFASVQQDDTMNGAMVIAVVDCMNTPISGASITVKQGTTDVGTIFDLGALAPQAAGTFFVFNVPDGSTVVTATYNSMAFPARTLAAHKKPNGNGTVGTITQTAIRPGV